MTSLTSLGDLSRADLLALFEEADAIAGGRLPELARGRIVVPLLFRRSPETALRIRSGAATLGAATLDPAEVWPGFPNGLDLHEAVEQTAGHADLLVLRHDAEGAPGRLAEDGLPVLAAGDGTRGDPLGGLVALDALRQALGTIEERTVAVCGDLRRNPVAHTALRGLARLGARILLVPSEGGGAPEGLLADLTLDIGGSAVRFPAHSLRTFLDMVDTVFLSPTGGSQLGLFAAVAPTSDDERRRLRHEARNVDAMVLAAPCGEDGRPAAGGEAVVLYREPFDGGEEPGEAPPWRPPHGRDRALAAALLARLLGAGFAGPGKPPSDVYRAREGVRCRHPACATSIWPELYEPRFRIARQDPVVLSCLDCGTAAKARFVGSRHQRRYHPLTSRQVAKIKRENVVFFADEREAERTGYVRSRI